MCPSIGNRPKCATHRGILTDQLPPKLKAWLSTPPENPYKHSKKLFFARSKTPQKFLSLLKHSFLRLKIDLKILLKKIVLTAWKIGRKFFLLNTLTFWGLLRLY